MLCKARQKILWGETCGKNFFLPDLGGHMPGMPILGSAPEVENVLFKIHKSIWDYQIKIFVGPFSVQTNYNNISRISEYFYIRSIFHNRIALI